MKTLGAVPGLVSATCSDGGDHDDDGDGDDGSDDNGGDDDDNSEESTQSRMDIMSFQHQTLRLPETSRSP